MPTSIHKFDSGIQFLITVQDENGPVNISTVQNINLFFQKPNGEVISRDCSTVNASTGLISYLSSSTDFDQVGKWRMQIVIRFSDSNIKHSDIGVFTVYKNISTS